MYARGTDSICSISNTTIIQDLCFDCAGRGCGEEANRTMNEKGDRERSVVCLFVCPRNQNTWNKKMRFDKSSPMVEVWKLSVTTSPRQSQDQDHGAVRTACVEQ